MPGEAIALSVIVPAFNEALRLPNSLAILEKYANGARFPVEVIVVDDGSTDDTAAVVERWGRGRAWLRVLREPHRGKGGAVRAGMLSARGNFRLLADADLSMPIRELPRFIDCLAAADDVVVGTREGAGARRVGEPASRHVMGRIFNLIARAIGVTDLADTQCGFKAFSGAAAEYLFSRLTINGFAFDLEILSLAAEAGYRVTVLPIEWHFEASSRVNPIRDSIDMLVTMLRIRLRTLRRRPHPRDATPLSSTWLKS